MKIADQIQSSFDALTSPENAKNNNLAPLLVHSPSHRTNRSVVQPYLQGGANACARPPNT